MLERQVLDVSRAAGRAGSSTGLEAAPADRNANVPVTLRITGGPNTGFGAGRSRPDPPGGDAGGVTEVTTPPPGPLDPTARSEKP